jgi:LCP family protein required for cell wall assembly
MRLDTRWLRTAVLAACLLSACTPSASPPGGPATTAAPTTTAPLTTTTSGPAAPDLGEVAPGWAQAVADVYGRACAGDRSRVPAELTGWPQAESCPVGQGTSYRIESSFGTTVLAAAQMGPDVIFGVDYGSGFQVVAARLDSLGLPGWYGHTPKIIAAIGADARPGQYPGTSRADSLHLIGLDGRGGGGIVGIPRDSWVPIAGGAPNKINSALSRGGPETMLATLADLSGLPLDGYVLTGFEGFQEMVGNVLGGINFDVPYPIEDRAAGASFAAGLQYLNGPQALAFSRARKSLAGGDLTRQLNGGLVLLAALDGARALGPLALPRLIGESDRWMATDLALGDLLSLAALALDAHSIGNVVIPGRPGRAGTASVVFVADGAGAIFSDLADGYLAP